VDLSGLGRTPAPAPGGPAAQPGAPGRPPSGYVVDVTEPTFADVVQISLQVPVVFSLWASWSELSATVTAELVALAQEFAGRFLLARVDVDGSPQVAQAFQAQSVPAVVAVLKGQPLPLFQGAASREEMRAVLDQLLQAAAANGVTGRLPAADGAEPEPEPEPQEPELPPLHQAAFEAIERDDLDAAVAAYGQALQEDPRDEMARVGLAQVELLRRTRGVDPATARASAAADAKDVDAQMVVADLDLLAGAVEDAFSRLVDAVRVTSGPERERARVRLIELFAVVGDADPRVLASRRALASALY
jgi:putative thioredoxin